MLVESSSLIEVYDLLSPGVAGEISSLMVEYLDPSVFSVGILSWILSVRGVRGVVNCSVSAPSITSSNQVSKLASYNQSITELYKRYEKHFYKLCDLAKLQYQHLLLAS